MTHSHLLHLAYYLRYQSRITINLSLNANILKKKSLSNHELHFYQEALNLNLKICLIDIDENFLNYFPSKKTNDYPINQDCSYNGCQDLGLFSLTY